MMMDITYEACAAGIRVKLDGKRVGVIKPSSGSDPIGYYYQPVGNAQLGEIFPKLVDVKRSLEAS